MPFISAETVSRLAVEVLARELRLPARVLRVAAADYTGSGGKTIVAAPVRRAARKFTDSIVYTAHNEVPVEVDVERWYDAAKVSPESSTLELRDFGRQVVRPMVAGLAEAAEDVLAAAMNAVTPSFAFTDLTDPAKVRDDVLRAREELTSADVPLEGRTLAVAPDVATALLRIPELVRANEAGSDQALRGGVIGSYYGFTVVESNAIAASTAVAFHREGFCFASLPPAAPRGGAEAATVTQDGLGLRTVFAYDPAVGGDVILVDVFIGAALIDAERVVRIAPSS
jgi:hypothetical protein